MRAKGQQYAQPPAELLEKLADMGAYQWQIEIAQGAPQWAERVKGGESALSLFEDIQFYGAWLVRMMTDLSQSDLVLSKTEWDTVYQKSYEKARAMLGMGE